MINNYINDWISVIEQMNYDNTYKLAWGRAILECVSFDRYKVLKDDVIIEFNDIPTALIIVRDKAILKIVFWNTPINVYLYFIKHFEKYNTKAFTTRALAVHLYNLLLEYDDSFIDYNYNNIDIRNFENDITNLKLDPYVVLIKKVFNESDSWFGIYKNNTPRVIANKFYDNDIVRKICNKYNGCLAGTVGLSYFGSIYRNKLDNVTLAIETSVLGNIINDTLNEYFSGKTNKAERESIVTDYIINEFKTTALYKALIKLDKTSLKSS